MRQSGNAFFFLLNVFLEFSLFQLRFYSCWNVFVVCVIVLPLQRKGVKSIHLSIELYSAWTAGFLCRPERGARF